MTYVVDRDYGELGVMVHACGDPSVFTLAQHSGLSRELAWTTSESADAENHDQETDLCAIGNPGGAVWASVAPEGEGWAWNIYSRWGWEDIDADPDALLSGGQAGDEDRAKAAVTDWVSAQRVTVLGAVPGNAPAGSDEQR
jgi:hypothetical protein